MAEPKIIEIKTSETYTHRGLAWEIANPIGNVVIFEGMEEHLYRYDYFAKKLNEAGYSVYGLDCFGQGLNAGERMENVSVWPKYGFDKQIDAYDKLVLQVSKNDKPTMLFCHSMGSYMGQWYIQKYSNHISRIVLCGSGGKNPAVPMGLLLAKIITNKRNHNQKAKMLNNLMFGNFNKRIDNPKNDFEWLSYNTANVDKYIADPLCGFGPTNGFCLEFLRGMNGLYGSKRKNIRKDLPIYIITGDEDPVTTYAKVTPQLKAMYNKLGLYDVDTKIYEHARHEILNEDIRDDVIKDIIAFYKA